MLNVRWRTAAFVLALGVVGGAVGACSDDEDDASGDVERYCELEAELEAAGEEVFANADPEASETDLLSAFFEEHDEQFDELLQVAPEEIAADVRAVYEANLAFIDGDEGAAEEVEEADDRLTAFAEESCN